MQISPQGAPNIRQETVTEDVSSTAFIRKLENHLRFTSSERDALQRLTQLNVRNVRSRVTFIEASAPASEISIILSGWACRYKMMPDGRRIIVAFHIPGDVCDFHALLTTAADTATEAMVNAKVSSISRQALGNLTALHPRAGQALWWESLVSASIQREWLVNATRRNASERVAHLLCELHVRQAAIADGAEEALCMPLTQADLGNACGMTTEHTNRTLRDLQKADLIVLDKRVIAIKDPDALVELSGFDPAYLHMQTQKVASARSPGAIAIDKCLNTAEV